VGLDADFKAAVGFDCEFHEVTFFICARHLYVPASCI
jgi:hypothetical protein